MKLNIIVGTRPDIIKMGPLIRFCHLQKIPFFVTHTGQHYSYDMDQIFFNELELPQPKYNLQVKSKSPLHQGEHTGTMMIKIEEILLSEQPSMVLVHGDTNTALAAALTTSKISTTKEYTGRHITLGHVESGLRSYDRTMPEELNRVITDHLSNFLFVPTKEALYNALKEGIEPHKVHITGNTIVDAVLHSVQLAEEKSKILEQLSLQKKRYILITVHRQENVDNERNIRGIFQALADIHQKMQLPLLYPMHPRTKKMMQQLGLSTPAGVQVLDPVGFLDFLRLEKHAALILTDSGGVQEEACILGTPCVTLRENTERPETVTVGANRIAGTHPGNILDAALHMVAQENKWENPLGEGNAAQQILSIIHKHYKQPFLKKL